MISDIDAIEINKKYDSRFFMSLRNVLIIRYPLAWGGHFKDRGFGKGCSITSITS